MFYLVLLPFSMNPTPSHVGVPSDHVSVGLTATELAGMIWGQDINDSYGL